MNKAASLLGSDSLLHFVLRSSNNIINSKSNRIYFLFPIKVSSHLIICLNKLLQLFLQTIILIIQICHMFIKSINFCFQIKLIFKHLISVLF